VDLPAATDVSSLGEERRLMIVNSLLEGARGNATTTMPRWNFYEASAGIRNAGKVTSWNMLAIPRDTSLAAVKERRRAWIICPLRPIVVRQSSLVSALVA
jgi:hypothetical protein